MLPRRGRRPQVGVNARSNVRDHRADRDRRHRCAAGGNRSRETGSPRASRRPGRPTPPDARPPPPRRSRRPDRSPRREDPRHLGNRQALGKRHRPRGDVAARQARHHVVRAWPHRRTGTRPPAAGARRPPAARPAGTSTRRARRRPRPGARRCPDARTGRKSTNTSAPENPRNGASNRRYVDATAAAPPAPQPARRDEPSTGSWLMTTVSGTASPPGTPVEIVLQDDGRGCRVEPGLARPPVAFADAQLLVGLVARQTLVLQVDRQAATGAAANPRAARRLVRCRRRSAASVARRQSPRWRVGGVVIDRRRSTDAGTTAPTRRRDAGRQRLPRPSPACRWRPTGQADRAALSEIHAQRPAFPQIA